MVLSLITMELVLLMTLTLPGICIYKLEETPGTFSLMEKLFVLGLTPQDPCKVVM
jgi:hypothetical protein